MTEPNPGQLEETLQIVLKMRNLADILDAEGVIFRLADKDPLKKQIPVRALIHEIEIKGLVREAKEKYGNVPAVLQSVNYVQGRLEALKKTIADYSEPH